MRRFSGPKQALCENQVNRHQPNARDCRQTRRVELSCALGPMFVASAAERNQGQPIANGYQECGCQEVTQYEEGLHSHERYAQVRQ
jgi:hypothetical protein